MKTTTLFIQCKLFLWKRICLAAVLIVSCAAPNVGFSNTNGIPGGVTNRPPTLTAKVADSYCVGDFVEIQLVGKDPDGDLLVYEGTGLPQGLHINYGTGLLSGVLELNFGAGTSTNYEVIANVREYPVVEGAPFTELTINIFVISTCDAHVSGFSLIDAATNTSLGALNEGDILDLHLLPPQLSVRANVSSSEGPIESVVFAFNRNNRFRTENIEPYALGGDINGEFLKVNFPLGYNTIMATPYSLNRGKGVRGLSKTIHFKVIRSTGNRPPQITADVKNRYCRGDRIEIQFISKDPDGDRLRYSIDPRGPLPPHLSIDPLTGLVSGLLVRGVDDGTSTSYEVLVKATDPGGLSVFVVLGIFSVDCGKRISSFTLVDAFTNKDIRRLKEGEVLNLSKLPSSLSIRADLFFPNSDDTDASVAFDFNGVQKFQTENLFPYSLGGDNNGDYKPVNFRAGLNTITATILNSPDDMFDDVSFVLNFKVLVPTLASLSSETYMNTSAPDLNTSFNNAVVQIYPNPFSSRLTLNVFSASRDAGKANLYNSSGQLVHSQTINFNKGNQQVEISASDLPAGVYLLHVMNQGKLIGKPLKVIRL